MQINEQEVKEQLLAQDAEYARLFHEHSRCKSMLQELMDRPHLTEAEQVEEIRIKKLKLSLKDRMEDILHRRLQTA
ncbi:MAG: DUF465 domain-containing protein [Acidobacteria bacterium]|nr:DUF465 domain-containing protein [Acidobacteriota bacterium]